jgi:hypothetical protein
MDPIRPALETSTASHVHPRRRGQFARLTLVGTLGLTLCLGAAAAGLLPPDSASGGPGTVHVTHPLDSASGGPGTVYDAPPDSASGGPGTV